MKGSRLKRKEKDLVGIALDNNCAVEFIDHSFKVITSKESANAYKVYKRGTEIIKEVIPKDSKLRDFRCN